MRRGFMLSMAVCVVALSAQAATRGACYSGADIEAEQAIRFQTQVMVLSDICRDSTYNSFSQHVRDALTGYQRQMVEHFRRTGRGSGERVLDSFMTRLANEFSLAAGHQSVAELCQGSASLLATANGFANSTQFRHYIAEQTAPNRKEYVACK